MTITAPRPAAPFLSPFLWLAAFICALYPLHAFQLELMAASVVMLLLWSYDRLSRAVKNGLSAPRSLIVAIIAGLWGLSFASIFWSDIPWNSILFFFFMGALPVTFLTLAFSPYERAEWMTTWIGAGIIMGVLGLWAILQIAFFADYFDGRASHPLRDPNSLAALFNIALIPSLGWLGLAGRRRHVIAAFALSALLLGGMVATGSRGGFFMLIGGVAMMALVYRHAISLHWRRWVVMGVLLAGCLAAPLLATSQDRTTWGRVGATLDIHAPAVPGERMLLMQSGWRMVKDHWVGGTGIGTFYLYYPAYRDPAQRGLTTHAHNDPLQIWAEMGVIAPLLLYALFIAAVAATWRRARRLPADAPQRPSLMLSFISLGVLMAHSHFNLNLYNLSILMMAGLVFAYWFSQLDVPRINLPVYRKKSAQAGLAIFFAVPLIAYGCIIASEYYLARARDAMIAGRIDDYGLAMMAADKVGLHKNPGVYIMAAHIPVMLLHQNSGELEPDEWAEQAAQINNNLDAALAGNPRLALAWYYKGLLAQLVPADSRPDSLQEAVPLFERALALDPLHLGARIALIDEALSREDYEAAADLIRPMVHVHLYTQEMRELYNRGLMVFHLLGDEKGTQKIMDAVREYDKQQKTMIRRAQNTPWRRPDARTFPQAVESAEE